MCRISYPKGRGSAPTIQDRVMGNYLLHAVRMRSVGAPKFQCNMQTQGRSVILVWKVLSLSLELQHYIIVVQVLQYAELSL